MSTRWNSTAAAAAPGSRTSSPTTRSTSGSAASSGSRRLPDEAGGAGDRDVRHLHTLTAWPTDPQPGDPTIPTTIPEPRAFPATARRSGAGRRLPGRSTRRVRLLADRPRPGDADAAVDRARSTGRSRARPPSGSRSKAGTEPPVDRRATARSSRSWRTPRRPSSSARPARRHVRHHVRTVGPKGWVDLHLDALRPVLEALATTLGDGDAAADDDRRRPTTIPELTAGSPGMPRGMPAIGNMLQHARARRCSACRPAR